MTRSCSVHWCKSKPSIHRKHGISFHLFPTDQVIRKVWIKACRNHVTWVPKPTSTICSQHFESACFIQLGNKRRLMQWAVPTLKLSEDNVLLHHNHDQTGSELDETKKLNQEIITDAQKENFQEPTHSFKQDPQQCSQMPTALVNQNLVEQKYQQRISTAVTAREKKLEMCLKSKNLKIKKLQSQLRYLNKKVADLKEIINTKIEHIQISPITRKQSLTSYFIKVWH